MPKPNEYTIRAKYLEKNLCVQFFTLFCCTDFRENLKKKV